MIRKPKLILLLAAIGMLSGGILSQNAEAIPISGNITFAGSVTFDTASLGSATTAYFQNTVVQSVDGDLDLFVNDQDSVAMASAWVFNPSTDTDPLWSVGGWSFHLTSSTVVFQTNQWLLITGEGTVSGHGGDGYEETSGTWQFSTQSPSAGGKFSYSAASSVPDGGSTLILLGTALLAVGCLKLKESGA